MYVKTGKQTASCQQCVLQIWGELVMGRVSGGASWINISNVTGASCIDDISVWGEFAWGEFVLGRLVQSPIRVCQQCQHVQRLSTDYIIVHVYVVGGLSIITILG